MRRINSPGGRMVLNSKMFGFEVLSGTHNSDGK